MTLTPKLQSEMDRVSNSKVQKKNKSPKAAEEEYDNAVKFCLCILAGISVAALADCISNINSGAPMTASDNKIIEDLKKVGVDAAVFAKEYVNSNPEQSIFKSMRDFVQSVADYAFQNNIEFSNNSRDKLKLD